MSGATISNVGLENVDITGGDNTGALLGYVYKGTNIVTNCYATGNVGSSGIVGGLVGRHEGGSIADCHAEVIVNGGSSDYTGGLVGFCHASIERSYATGNVTTTGTSAGGLVGYSTKDITKCYATGDVSGGGQTGGLVGRVQSGSIKDCYATGAVDGGSSDYTGGLVGLCLASIENSYSTGGVTGTGSHIGGLVGQNYGPVTGSYWDTATSGQGGSDGGTGKTTAEMSHQATYVGWDFTNIWTITEGETYPCFQWQSGPWPPIPELPSIILFAIGLLALAGYIRWTVKKKKE